MAQLFWKCGYSLTFLVIGIASACAAQPATEISALPGARLYTESITSTKDGTLILGSLGKGDVSHIAPGSTTAEEWIKPGTNGLNQVFGVYADEKFKNLWVCSGRNNAGEAARRRST